MHIRVLPEEFNSNETTKKRQRQNNHYLRYTRGNVIADNDDIDDGWDENDDNTIAIDYVHPLHVYEQSIQKIDALGVEFDDEYDDDDEEEVQQQENNVYDDHGFDNDDDEEEDNDDDEMEEEEFDEEGEDEDIDDESEVEDYVVGNNDTPEVEQAHQHTPEKIVSSPNKSSGTGGVDEKINDTMKLNDTSTSNGGQTIGVQQAFSHQQQQQFHNIHQQHLHQQQQTPSNQMQMQNLLLAQKVHQMKMMHTLQLAAQSQSASGRNSQFILPGPNPAMTTVAPPLLPGGISTGYTAHNAVSPEEQQPRLKYTAKCNMHNEELWDKYFYMLKQYKMKHGHCKVSTEDPENKRLGLWVKRQRYQYKLLKTGKTSKITLDRVNKLNSIGFVWRCGMNTWQQRLKEFEAFIKSNGHDKISKHDHVLNQLATWVRIQRQEYKKFVEGKPSAMSAEKVRELTRVGFDFKQDGKKKTSNTAKNDSAQDSATVKKEENSD